MSVLELKTISSIVIDIYFIFSKYKKFFNIINTKYTMMY